MRQKGEQLSNNITGKITVLNKTQSTEGVGVFVVVCFSVCFLRTAIKEGLLEEVTFEQAHEGNTGARLSCFLF